MGVTEFTNLNIDRYSMADNQFFVALTIKKELLAKLGKERQSFLISLDKLLSEFGFMSDDIPF